jgi:hypothetical protein
MMACDGRRDAAVCSSRSRSFNYNLRRTAPVGRTAVAILLLASSCGSVETSERDPTTRDSGPIADSTLEAEAPPHACVPKDCPAGACGMIDDGCGKQRDCGPCDTGDAGCKPRACSPGGCGVSEDGCGGTLDCGRCAAPSTCGGGGTPNVCGSCGRCCSPIPITCAELGLDCGHAPDGCGGELECGDCTAPQVCGGAGTPNVCGAPSDGGA